MKGAPQEACATFRLRNDASTGPHGPEFIK